MIVSLEALGTNAYNCYAMCPAEEGRRTYRPKHYRNNNKDEDNSSKTLNDKKDFLYINILFIYFMSTYKEIQILI